MNWMVTNLRFIFYWLDSTKTSRRGNKNKWPLIVRLVFRNLQFSTQWYNIIRTYHCSDWNIYCIHNLKAIKTNKMCKVCAALQFTRTKAASPSNFLETCTKWAALPIVRMCVYCILISVGRFSTELFKLQGQSGSLVCCTQKINLNFWITKDSLNKTLFTVNECSNMFPR